MAETTEEVPLIVIQPDKIFSSWKSTIKLCVAIVFAFVLYGYLHVHIRTFLMKNKKLQGISVMLMETEKLMQDLYFVDQTLLIDMEDLNDLCLDYY